MAYHQGIFAMTKHTSGEVAVFYISDFLLTYNCIPEIITSYSKVKVNLAECHLNLFFLS